MNTPVSAAAAAASSSTEALAPQAPRAARSALHLLGRLQHGDLQVITPGGQALRFGNGREPHAVIQLHTWDACAATLRSGDIGFAEAHIDGTWDSPDVSAALRVLLLNRERIEAAIYGSWWGRLIYRLKHALHRNSRAGSRRNIHAHYDIGNPFYRLWLDPTMSYSGAWFGGNRRQSLEQAQHAKMRRVLMLASVRPGARVLEIGCGWGALAEVAARDFQAHVTGITLSTAQLDWARGRIEQARLAERVQLKLQDYRDPLDGPFDAVVSVEMFEAVGRGYWPAYFDALKRHLKPGGRACIQSITVRDDLFERYCRGSDFIQQYIFPGGLLPSESEFRRAAGRAGLEVLERSAFGPDYAETLRRWRAAFVASRPDMQQLGCDARFLRTWEFYLAYCEAAFDAGTIDVMQFVLRRPA